MLVAFSVSPTGGDESGSVGAAVAEAVRVVRASGLACETNAMFTNIEGEWDVVMAVVKQAVEVMTTCFDDTADLAACIEQGLELISAAAGRPEGPDVAAGPALPDVLLVTPD